MLDVLLAQAERVRLARPSCVYCAVNKIDFFATEAATGGVYLAPVRPVPPRSFEFDPNGTEAVVIEAINEYGDVEDLVKWSTTESDRVTTMFGRCALLGAFGASDPQQFLFDEPLHVHPDPVRWLQSRCTGVVVLDQLRAARWLLDVPCSRIAVESDQQGQKLLAARRRLFAAQRMVVSA